MRLWAVRGLCQPVAQPLDQIHALVQDGDDQCRSVLANQAESVVMVASGHAQSGVHLRHIAKGTLPCDEAGNATLQLGHVGPHLRVTPLLAGVANDRPDISFRRRRQYIAGAQEC